jgi:hypothetical protein
MSCCGSSCFPVGTDPELILAFYLQQIGNIVEDVAYIRVTNGHCLLLSSPTKVWHVREPMDNLFGAEAAIDRSGCFYPH